MKTPPSRAPVAVFAALVLLCSLAGPVQAQPSSGWLKSTRFIAPTPWEEGMRAGKMRTNSKYDPNTIYADRKVYWNDDPVGQFLVTFMKADWQGKKVTLEVLTSGGSLVKKTTIGPMTQPKAALLLAVNSFKPGKYKLRATLVSGAGAPPANAEKAAEAQANQVETAFEREDKANPVIAFPAEGLAVRVDPQNVVANGAWPICTGVPFPQGTMTDLSKLVLLENGKPVPAQITKVCTWHPEPPEVSDIAASSSSVSWARLSFVAHYADGKPASYVLKLADSAPPAPPKVTVAQEGDLITVDNGAVKFQVSTKSFRGVEAAWYDPTGKGSPRKVIDGASGAYIVDEQGAVYEACEETKPSVVIEESGPVRAVIAAEGWYTKRGEGEPAKLCIFRTRIIACAGEPMVRVYQHTILTGDSNKVRLADVGMRIGVPEAKSWSMGADGKPVEGVVPAKGASVFMHQYRWDKLRITTDNGASAAAGESAVPSTPGGKSDGWFTLKGSNPGAVTVLVRDFWQKFPKEMEIDANGFNLHFWPRHGTSAFTRAEAIARPNIYKLWYMHEGKLLNLAFPQYAFDALKKIDATPALKWDYEEMTEHAKSGNAQGVALGNEYILRFHAAAATDQPAQAALFQLDPHAISDPDWNAKTLVEGKISAFHPERFPLLEQAIDTFWPDYMKVVVDAGTEYGMWIYGDVHDRWDPGAKEADLHRVWSASHYRNVSTAWLYYFRGGSPENLQWAAANTDHFMDVDTVNYASVGADDKGNARTEFKFHLPGAMYHAKGFTPWGATAYGEKTPDLYGSIWGHFVNPDAYRYRYLLEGNGRAWDLYMLWARSMKSYDIPTTYGRDVNGTFGEEISYYTTTWDPDFLRLINTTAEGMLGTPMDQMPAPYDHPGWHRFWYSRLYTLTRDPRVKTSVIEYCKNYGKKFATMMAWAYQQTGDKSYLDVPMAHTYDAIHAIYRNPGDPVSGYRDNFSAYDMFFYQEMPYYIQALADAGITDISPGEKSRSVYLSHATHPDMGSEKIPALLVAALKPKDAPFTVRMESIPGYDVYSPAYRVIAPDGKVVHAQATPAETGTHRYNGDKAITFTIPADGQTGVYQIDCRNWEGMRFFAPFTDFPVEGQVLSTGVPGVPPVDDMGAGRVDLYLMPIGVKPRIRLAWKQLLHNGSNRVGYVRVEDADGAVLLETTLLVGTKRSTATLNVDTAKNKPPYHLYMFSTAGPAMQWTGNAKALVAAQTPENAKALAEAWEKVMPAAAPAK